MCKDFWLSLIIVLTYPTTFIFGMAWGQSIIHSKAIEANVAYYDSKTTEFKFIDVKSTK